MNTNICYSILYQYVSFMLERYTPVSGSSDDENCTIVKGYIEQYKTF